MYIYTKTPNLMYNCSKNKINKAQYNLKIISITKNIQITPNHSSSNIKKQKSAKKKQ